MKASVAAALLVVVALNVGAGEGPATQHAAVATDTFPHPVLPRGSSAWVGVMMQVVGAMFILAVVIGVMVRRHGGRDLPPVTHAHDEPPGSSGHHGRTGTVDLAPPDRH